MKEKIFRILEDNKKYPVEMRLAYFFWERGYTVAQVQEIFKGEEFRMLSLAQRVATINFVRDIEIGLLKPDERLKHLTNQLVENYTI